MTDEQEKKLTVISLGWGMQSWVLVAMSALGELPKVDFAIHSDTTWERGYTYEFAKKWTPWLEDRGVKVVIVSDAKQARKVYTAKTDIPASKSGDVGGSVFIPAVSRYEGDRVIDEYGGVSGNAYTTGKNIDGQLRRQCTQRWKIAPMRRYITRELERLEISKKPGVVEQWLGITLDEWQRAKDSDVKYIIHKFPLLDKNMTRQDCINWLQRNNLPTPGKSSCTFCPYHSIVAWQQLKRQNGKDWAQAVEVDERIRNKRPPYPLFVHPERKPLPEAVKIPEDYGATQLELFSSNDKDAECDSGYCFL